MLSTRVAGLLEGKEMMIRKAIGFLMFGLGGGFAGVSYYVVANGLWIHDSYIPTCFWTAVAIVGLLLLVFGPVSPPDRDEKKEEEEKEEDD